MSPKSINVNSLAKFRTFILIPYQLPIKMVKKQTYELSAPDSPLQVLLGREIFQIGLQKTRVGHYHNFTKKIYVTFYIFDIKPVPGSKTGPIQIHLQFTNNRIIL